MYRALSTCVLRLMFTGVVNSHGCCNLIVSHQFELNLLRASLAYPKRPEGHFSCWDGMDPKCDLRWQS